MHNKYWCKVRSTGEIYEAYPEKLIDTISREKHLSTNQANAVLNASFINEPCVLSEEDVWVEWVENG
jgi:hypothetical protein